MQRTSAIPAKKSSSHLDERVRAVRRNRTRRRMPRLLWIVPALLIFLALSAMMAANFAQYRKYQRQADFKAAQLASLSETQTALDQRLSFLQLPKGREQVLLEHGFLKPGERILLFPADKAAPDNAANANVSSAGLTDTTTLSDKDDGGNAWQRTARTLSSWMHKLQGDKNARY